MTIDLTQPRLFINGDCMEYMKQIPDKCFELAIVDPPYGINRSKNFGLKEFGWIQHKRSDWDSNIPEIGYFKQLLRVSQHQIIWGGNYFVKHLEPSMGWIVWDKCQRNFSTSDGELAYSSFERKLKICDLSRGKALADNGGTTIHPTQKPIQLYRWLLHNYAKPGWKILDTHVGSGSSLIACEWEGFDYVGFEIDADYYAAAKKRIENWRKSRTLDLFKSET